MFYIQIIIGTRFAIRVGITTIKECDYASKIRR